MQLFSLLLLTVSATAGMISVDEVLDREWFRSLDRSQASQISSGSSQIIDEGNVILGRYHLLQRIGQGQFGVVYSATDQFNNRKVAIKIFSDTHTVSQLAQIDGEYRQFAEAESNNYKVSRKSVSQCIKVLDEFIDQDHYYMVFELFQSSLEKHKKSLSAKSKQFVGREVLKCLNSLTSFGYQHGDVRHENVFIDFEVDQHGETVVNKVVLADFGLMSKIGALSYGSPGYEAPEVKLTAKCRRNSDIWSFGVMLAELYMGGQLMFPDEDQLYILTSIVLSSGQAIPQYLLNKSPWMTQYKSLFYNGRPSEKFKKTDQFKALDEIVNPWLTQLQTDDDQYIKDYLQQALVVDPLKRISAASSLKHSYFMQVVQE